ncbi:ion channel [Aquisediminimonas profunda]|uniref:ion channel n=1 Tax=Aquisediminimonas profunda TaxID=1550733 RepID=UPI001C62DC23|nr:ion channel [Aquisediminimonas profunda]
MLAELSLATVMVILTVIIHAVGLFTVARLLRLEELEEAIEHIHPMSLRGFGVTLSVILALIGLHGVEIWLYAFVYDFIGAVEGLRNAVYFSTITYGAIGYDDLAMADRWRLVAAIEGINGIVLIGWSTAFFVTLSGRMRRR